MQLFLLIAVVMTAVMLYFEIRRRNSQKTLLLDFHCYKVPDRYAFCARSNCWGPGHDSCIFFRQQMYDQFLPEQVGKNEESQHSCVRRLKVSRKRLVDAMRSREVLSCSSKLPSIKGPNSMENRQL